MSFFHAPTHVAQNQSIDVIRAIYLKRRWAKQYHILRKGRLHIRPPQESIEQSAKTAKARWIISQNGLPIRR